MDSKILKITGMEGTNNSTRRKFLRNTLLTTALSVSMPQLLSSAFAGEKLKRKINLKKGDVILFHGDSITDATRNKENYEANNSAALGSGYAMMASAELLNNHANKNLKIYNRGISGNKVYQLAERWENDTIQLRPDVLSILIGVNDFWHTLSFGYKGTIKTYNDDLRSLLEKTRQKLPNIKFIIGEPFAVKDIKIVNEKWYPAFNEYRKTARKIAESYDAVFIPYQSMYDKAQKYAPGVYWTLDGVHPTLAGANLMAHTWLQFIKS